MKVNEILSNGKITLSFEVFPPKTDAQFESGYNWRNDDCPFNMCSRNKGKYS